jgi:hypothetical protein
MARGGTFVVVCPIRLGEASPERVKEGIVARPNLATNTHLALEELL